VTGLSGIEGAEHSS